MKNRPEWRSTFRTTALVHGTIAASLFMYAVVFEVLRAAIRPLPRLAAGADIQLLRYVFYGLAIAAVIAVRLASRQVFRDRPGEPYREFLLRLSRGSILTSILCELPAVFGLMIVFLTGVTRDFYYLLFVSLFLAFMYFPRSRAWAETLRQRFPQEGG